MMKRYSVEKSVKIMDVGVALALFGLELGSECQLIGAPRDRLQDFGPAAAVYIDLGECGVSGLQPLHAIGA